MSEQSRSCDALAAAAANLATAHRAARNINRLRGNRGRPPSDPVNLDNLITALWHIHTITGYLGKIVDQHAHAARTPFAGYAGAGATPEGPADYPRSVATAAATAQDTLTALAAQLRRGMAVAFATDAIANLDIALHNWRTTTRRTGGGA